MRLFSLSLFVVLLGIQAPFAEELCQCPQSFAFSPPERSSQSDVGALFTSVIEGKGDVEALARLLELNKGVDLSSASLPCSGSFCDFVTLPEGVCTNEEEIAWKWSYCGMQLLSLATHTGNIAVAKFLLEHGAEVDALDVDGSTPLRYAASQGYFELAKLLLEYGARADATDGKGQTPLDYAYERGCRHRDMVELLLRETSFTGGAITRTLLLYAHALNCWCQAEDS